MRISGLVSGRVERGAGVRSPKVGAPTGSSATDRESVLGDRKQPLHDATPVTDEKVLTGWDYVPFTVLSGAGLGAIAYFARSLLSLQAWRQSPVAFTTTLLIVGVVLLSQQLRWFLLPFMRRPLPRPPTEGWNVAVVTTFVPGLEPLEMLEETLTALVNLDYPHDTWVLDEGDDEQVKRLCVRLGARHFSRKHLAHYQTESGLFRSRSKYGNYNAWLYEIGFDRYDAISSFDPDHVPVRSFLLDALGYLEDSRVGYVQAPQVYYNQKASFIARGAAEETYAYYSSIQMASYGMGYPIVVGCHTTHRMSALKQVGGFAPHDADDLLITLLYRAAGWRGVYVPKILAQGLTPVDWSGYIQQQARWARSVLDIKFRIYPRLRKNLPLKTQVVSFLHGLHYVQDSLVLFLSLSLMVFMLAAPAASNVFAYLMARLPPLLLILQLCDFYRQRFISGAGGNGEYTGGRQYCNMRNGPTFSSRSTTSSPAASSPTSLPAK
jgi:cellulose synthase/poly-beta-1,6-N-acetylglucosamine synthase-like glycosyltransferase